MNRFFIIASLILAGIILSSCGKVMMTGRKQFLLFSDEQIMSLSDQSYNQFKTEMKFSQNKKYHESVNKVGKRMTDAVYAYMKERGLEAEYKKFNWQFSVADNDQVNAFCLPNGKIVFYEGIFKYTDTPDKIAVVMGHEIAHAIAKHGNERMSQEALVGTAGSIVSQMIGGENQQRNQAIFNIAFNVGARVGILLPYSRKHEYEADKIGVIIMALAGYNINSAPLFWEAMMQKGGAKSEFLSTHPSDQNRIVKIKEILPEIEKTYKKK
ncbi:Beta-barrel assembly-enhancing protease [bioreactor metagenome]|uniref:Beta-barrel assembly-enhancing protease n=1 Tax=bioreactor metagenome TaxID=1076179 RepID=A0A645D3C6_9ZZZZ